jgi:hypothetical protein
MTGLVLKVLIRKGVDVRLQNMVAVQMEKQKLKERNLKDVRKCQSYLEVSYIYCKGVMQEVPVIFM